ncbi:NAD(P)-binding domain-containing protein [Benzoatithermus flavus]|uniref:NAD(P)-binding domain-containing protein n=1 Tax=Benzoatithermus flavus TaxID=3108223 RepID=A0ABU8XXX3_9PROT
MRIGLIGNHRAFAERLGEAGIDLVVHPAETANKAGLDRSGIAIVDRYEAFFAELEHPRLFLLDLPLGAAIDRTIDEAYVTMEPGDVVLDPSGSYWGDTLRRFRRMRHRSLFYVDLALLGEIPTGIVLAAGDRRGIELATPFLERLARPDGVICAGGAGAAHYALMVRDAVATSVVHALSEARQLLEAYPNDPEPDAVAGAFWPAGPHPGPRASWVLDDAVRLEAAIPLLAQGIMLEIAHALDEHRSREPAPRVGPFVHPDDIL